DIFKSETLRGVLARSILGRGSVLSVRHRRLFSPTSCPCAPTQLQIESFMDSRSAVATDRVRTPTLLANTWTHIRTSQFWMVSIALFLRVGWIIIGHTYKFKPAENNFGFGWEMGRIGAAIASGHGFADPFGAPTGPTAWEPPLYPYLTAGVFHFFGTYSHASAFVLLTINSIFSALTCIPIFLIARRIFSEKVAVGSAWTWALLPYVMFWGIAALNSTVLIAFLPASGLWAWYHRAKRHKPSFAGVVLASVVFIACVTPWTVRNYQTFGKFIFIRDNLGAELRLGNGNGADGTWMQYLHPTQDLYAMRQYTSMGELAYIEARKRQALDYIEADYPRFAVLCLKRFIYFWAGPPRLSQIWWLAEVKNSLFLASSVLMFWGLGRALRQRR